MKKCIKTVRKKKNEYIIHKHTNKNTYIKTVRTAHALCMYMCMYILYIVCI